MAMHDMYWVTEEAMEEGAPARILASGERTELPPTLCLARDYEASHPRPDLDEFISQYRKAGGQIDVTIFEEEGAGLSGGSLHRCRAADPRRDDRVHREAPHVTKVNSDRRAKHRRRTGPVG